MRMERLRWVWWLCILVFLVGQVDLVAQLKSRPAKDWIQRLERDERIQDLNLAEVIERLRLRPGQKVADIGAGSGVFSRPLAEAVSPGGRVYSVEVDAGFLEHINKISAEQGYANIRTVLGEFEDPRLPVQDIDLAFFHDVLHHIEHRERYLKNLVGYLQPKARICIIDMIKDHPESPHRDDDEVQVSADEVKAWLGALGFKLAEEHYLYDRKYFLVFERQ